jgi:hypothetical protein
MWTDIDMDDALELLGPGEAFRDRRVRGYAVNQIARVEDEVSVPASPWSIMSADHQEAP